MDSIETRLRDAKLGASIENAAGNLPDDYTIEINIECGSAAVTLWGPDGHCEFPTNHESLGQQIADATEFAIAESAKADGVTSA
jgi:hypothetical protein